MPGKVDKENEKRFGSKHRVRMYEAIKNKLLKEKEEDQDGPLSDLQKKHIKTKAAKITNASRYDS